MKFERLTIVFITLFTFMSMAIIPVFATTLTLDRLEVTLVTDKEDYKENKEIIATLKMKNINNVIVPHIS